MPLSHVKAPDSMKKCAHGGRMTCKAGCYAKGGDILPAKDKTYDQTGINRAAYGSEGAVGGEVDDDKSGDSELDGLLHGELSDAMKSGDGKRTHDCIEAIVENCLAKKRS